jgi:two-component sensor histidine kinase
MMKTDTLGLQLVSTLAEQLDGEITVHNHQGTKYLITFGKVKL